MIIAIIQARMGSTRLPGKVLLPLAGKPVIEHVIDRVRSSSLVDEVIVATSIESVNLPLVSHVAALGIKVFVGSENDVLDRFWQAIRLTTAVHVVRITADCPLLDSTVIDSVIQEHIESGNDYSTNTEPPTWPDGLDVEIMKCSALEIAWRESTEQGDREHVTPFIRKNKNRFRIGNIRSNVDLSDHRWTLDQEEDYKFLVNIFDNLGGGGVEFTTQQVLDFLHANPEVVQINSGIIRNEGSRNIKNEAKNG